MMRRVTETEVYRGSATVFVVPMVAVGCSLALLAIAMSRDVKAWVIGVFGLFLVYNVYLLLWNPYEVRVASDGMLTFRSLVRRRSVRVEDVQRIRRTTSEGGAIWLKFSFSRGSVRMVRCRRVEALESRLRKLNPSIRG
jgi:hypothetical protein